MHAEEPPYPARKRQAYGAYKAREKHIRVLELLQAEESDDRARERASLSAVAVSRSVIQSIGRTDGRSVAQQSCPLGMPPSRPLLTLLFEDVWLNADATPGRKAMVMWEAR